jgi:flagellar motor protein MotB
MSQEQPIYVIKKIIKKGGHHGGAWKVAYADFVTAMMAFFMVLWLLSSSEEVQRPSVATSLIPTEAVNRSAPRRLERGASRSTWRPATWKNLRISSKRP